MKQLHSLLFRIRKLTAAHYLLRLTAVSLLAVLMQLLLAIGVRLIIPAQELNTEADCWLTPASIFAVPTVAAVYASSDNGLHKKDITAGWRSRFHSYPVRAVHYAAELVFTLLNALPFFAVSLISGIAVKAQTGYPAVGNARNTFLYSFAFGTVFTAGYHAVLMQSRRKKDYMKFVLIAAVLGLSALLVAIWEAAMNTRLFTWDWYEYGFDPAVPDSAYDITRAIAGSFGQPSVAYISLLLIAGACALNFLVTWCSLERRKP